jgi:hypothetical protein
MDSALVTFEPAGSTDGIPLVVHACRRYRGITYVSAAASGEEDPYVVPGCGCRPAAEEGTLQCRTDR